MPFVYTALVMCIWLLVYGILEGDAIAIFVAIPLCILLVTLIFWGRNRRKSKISPLATFRSWVTR